MTDEVAEFRHGLGEAAGQQVLGGDHPKAEPFGVIEHARTIGEAAHADVPGVAGIDCTLKGGVGELGGGVVAVVIGERVGVGVAVDVQGDQARMTQAHSPHQRQGGGAVAADADGNGAGIQDQPGRCLDAGQGVVDPARGEHDVAAIDDAHLREHVDIGACRVKPPDQPGLAAHFGRAIA